MLKEDRGRATQFPASLDEFVIEDNPVRAVDVFVDGLNLDKLGFVGVQPLDTGEPNVRSGLAPNGRKLPPCRPQSSLVTGGNARRLLDAVFRAEEGF